MASLRQPRAAHTFTTCCTGKTRFFVWPLGLGGRRKKTSFGPSLAITLSNFYCFFSRPFLCSPSLKYLSRHTALARVSPRIFGGGGNSGDLDPFPGRCSYSVCSSSLIQRLALRKGQTLSISQGGDPHPTLNSLAHLFLISFCGHRTKARQCCVVAESMDVYYLDKYSRSAAFACKPIP